MSMNKIVTFDFRLEKPDNMADSEYYSDVFQPFVNELSLFPSVDFSLRSEKAAPEGTKGMESILADVGVAVAIDLAPKLFAFIKNWVQRDKKRGVKILTSIQGKSVEIDIHSDELNSDELTKLLGIINTSIPAGD